MAAPLLLLAPLRGVTQLEFRTCLARHFPGFDFAYSPFIPTMAGPRFKMSALRDVMPEPNAAAIPVIPQAIGKSPADFATLVSALKDLGYNRCDLNAGCPWPMIVKRGRGSGSGRHSTFFLTKVLRLCITFSGIVRGCQK